MALRLLIGNWKMNQTKACTVSLLNQFAQANFFNCEVVLCVPFVFFSLASDFLFGSSIKLGAQNCHHEEFGAYTGSISALMIKEFGCEYVIVGHSECRKYLKEDGNVINKKLQVILKHNLKPILCIGADLHVDLENFESAVLMPLKTELCGIPPDLRSKIVIAFEPNWAINSVHAAPITVVARVVSDIANLFGDSVPPIIYGGSVTSSNALEFLALPNLGGLLLGRASLDFFEFAKIAELFEI
ncbi:MAG: triose-phosphate isomerase [Oscillospiraceae bacterium]|jgi:triosephosphate isomerase|nr:triose-phosphate isomerase [Oscillospiraceae bacterium]